MDSSRRVAARRLILPLLLLHLAYGILFLFAFRAVTGIAVLTALFLITCCSLSYGKASGFLSGIALAALQVAGLALVWTQGEFPGASPASAAQLAATLLDLPRLAGFPALVLAPVWPSLALLPLFGFMTGLYAEQYGIRNPGQEKHVQALASTNQKLVSAVGQLEGKLQDLTQGTVYKREGPALLAPDPLSAHLVGLLLEPAADSRHQLNQQSDEHPGTGHREPGTARRLFRALVQARPEVLAVVNLDGRILCGNETLLAICGYPAAADYENASIFTLMQPEDASRAEGRIKRALIEGLQRDERYGLRPPARQPLPVQDSSSGLPADKNSLLARFGPSIGSACGTWESAGNRADARKVNGPEHGTMVSSPSDCPAGGFRRLLFAPQVYLELAGNPLAILACVCSLAYDESAYATGSMPGGPADRDKALQSRPVSEASLVRTSGQATGHSQAGLADRNLCCLTRDFRIYYLSPALAGLLGKPADAMLGKRFSRFVNRKHDDRLDMLEQAILAGERMSLELEMMPHDGRRRIFRIESFPSVDAGGQCLGCTLLAEDISSVRLVEEALQHRLSMEKMISSISTRFITILPADLDREIIQVLQMIGDFEQVEESQVEIYQSKRIRQGASYSVTRTGSAGMATPETSHTRTAQEDLNRFETISIPIVIESETAGHFRFLQKCYRESWFESDLELIHLIGEIIINGFIRKENELDITLNETRLATTIHSIGEGVIATDTEGRIVLMNQMAEALTGWPMELALQQPLDRVFQPAVPVPATQDSAYVNSLHPLSETDDSQLLTSSSGHQYYIQAIRSPIRDQQAVFGEVTVFRDVTREKQENDEIRYVSYHDKLTGLYNRAFFEEELIRLNTRRQYPITLIIGDCNGLKIANDIFGHLEGDRLLQKIAVILKKATRHEDIVARWGGDEFTIILPRTDETAGAAIRERILQLCAEADFDPIQPSLAMGSATNTEEGLACDDLVGVLKLAEDRMYRHKLMEGKSARNTLLLSIERMIYEKSYETEEHASRLKEFSKRLGRAVGLSNFEQEELSLLSVLHDIGKIGIPDVILTKPERLNDEEWEIMRKHAEKGYNLAKSTPELASIADSILHHHERWDGTGYPAGLQGEKIPKLSRILAIIDAYDVITHARSYKHAQSKRDALMEIERCAGTQFDPELTKVFVEIMKQD